MVKTGFLPTMAWLPADPSARRVGRRSLLVTFIVILLFSLHFLYSVSSRSKPPSVISHGTAPSTSASTSTPAPSPTQPPPILSPPEQRSSCPVTKVSMLYGSHRFGPLIDALDTHRRHSERWGCAFESLEEDLTSRKLYSKHYFLLSTMLHELAKPAEQRKQWLMWVDADSIIVNPAISPCIFLPPEQLEDVFAVVTADHQGLNNGVFFLRVHRSSVDLLTQITDYPLAHPDEDLGWFGEQAAMENVIKSTEKQLKDDSKPPGIAWVPRQWFNAYEFEHGFEGEPGHFMVHFAGLAETRISHMANWIEELRRNQVKWEIPLEDTFYKNAVPEFWDEFAANATKGV